MRGWLGCLLAVATPLAAQPRLPSDGGTTTSLGQPNNWLWSLGWSVGARSQVGDEAVVVDGRVGVYHELLNRVLGLGGVQVEAYGGSRDTRPTAGLRGRLVSPFLRVGIGADYNVDDRDLRPIYSFVYPGRRGGLFHDGSVLRLDLITGTNRTLEVGIETPIRRRIPWGRTRPLRDHVPLANRRPPPIPLPSDDGQRRDGVRLALDAAREAAGRIQALCAPWLDHRGSGDDASDAAVLRRIDQIQRDVVAASNGMPEIPAIDQATRQFHDAVDLAFSRAIAPPGVAGDSATAAGRAVARHARAILLREVLLPYDRLLGQLKDDDTTREFAVLARGDFVRWLHAESGVPRPYIAEALAVFTDILEMVESNRAAAHETWSGSRFVWLPLQFALLPEEHDTQEELDALVALATEEPFTEGNFASYIINEQFQYQLSRTIRQARDYHVLQVHDIRGFDEQGHPDEMTFRHVLRSYLAAMTARVRAYDSTGTFPVYMIILDEWFYDVNGSRLWMSLLEDPLRHRVHLPAGFAAWEDSLGAAQDSLRAAVARSSLLAAQRQQYGEGWFYNLIKVHVNITNAFDPTFWSWRVAAAFPVPDTWMRDHRKLVFYDITEEDPYRGEAILTGSGVGEHYASVAWEDRSVLVRGPAVLALKTATRDLLLNQGIPLARIPAVLQPRPRPGDYDARVRQAIATSAQRPLRALEIQNGTGYAAKQVNVAKAVLYTLMPSGSVIKIPDSLWNGTFWGSALLGAALRGARILVISPALANAPARAFGSITRNRELLWRLLMASRILAPQIEATGGLLKVGVFASDLKVTDIPGKVFSVRRTLEKHQWLHDLFDFPPEVYPGLDSIAEALDGRGATRAEREFESRDRSQLHIKANFFASREAWTVMARNDWVAMTREFVRLRMEQIRRRSAAVSSFEDSPDALTDVGEDVLKRWYAGLTPAMRSRVIFYTVLGSHNQNDRSLGSDGEDALVISNWPSVIPYLDLISLVGQSDWIEEPEQLETYLPRAGWFKRRIAHWLKVMY